MEFNEFLAAVKENVQRKMGDEYIITVTHIRKNNGVTEDGILIARKEKGISPAYYLNNQYRSMLAGKRIDQIADEIIKLYHNSGFPHQLPPDFFNSFQNVKENILFKLIHYYKNQELLDHVPHIRYLDLAIVFYCGVPGRFFEKGTILIHHQHLEQWQVQTEDLRRAAADNTRRLAPEALTNMEEVLRGLFVRRLKQKFESENKEILVNRFMSEQYPELVTEGLKRSDGRYKMYVLSNKDQLFGAAAMLYPGVVERFAEQLDCNLYLLPASVHEIIIVPDDGNGDKDDLQMIVGEINDTNVDPEEVLSYSVYYYDRQTRDITICAE